MEEYANFLKTKEPDLSSSEALNLAQEVFIYRGEKNMPPLTKYDLYFEEEIDCDPAEILEYYDEVKFNVNRPNQKKVAEGEVEEEGMEEEV
jgi:hypothetical protein